MDKWKGYKCFKVYLDHKGDLLPKPKYAVFRDNVLMDLCDTETEAGRVFHGERAWLVDEYGNKIRLGDFEGIDRRLRSPL